MTKTRKLQYQLSNGSWFDCEERTEEFLGRCEVVSEMSREDVLAILETNETVRNDFSDWYSNCRFAPVETKEEIINDDVICDCGHHVPSNLVMNASMGSSCPNCYDKMSY